MKVYVDSESKIRDVGSTSDTTLTELTINDESNPFKGWSIAKICCFKVAVSDGIVTSISPYINSELIEHIDRLGMEIADLRARIEYLENK